jgi:hypothetical protein
LAGSPAFKKAGEPPVLLFAQLPKTYKPHGDPGILLTCDKTFDLPLPPLCSRPYSISTPEHYGVLSNNNSLLGTPIFKIATIIPTIRRPVFWLGISTIVGRAAINGLPIYPDILVFGDSVYAAGTGDEVPQLHRPLTNRSVTRDSGEEIVHDYGTNGFELWAGGGRCVGNFYRSRFGRRRRQLDKECRRIDLRAGGSARRLSEIAGV